MQNKPGHTLADWSAALLEGADLLSWLQAARARALAAADLGLWIHLCPEARWAGQIALLQQRLGEDLARRALLQRYPLLGVPFAVKDNIDIAGEPTTAACPAFSHIAPVSATVVQRLLDAGALWLGKTNLDQFATGLVGTRSPYGRPASVADAARISGGSSSGSAVAVARGIVPFALGTDTAGSGRVPAGFNGLVGLKPTPGRVSTAGVVPACRTLDCVSIFAHTRRRCGAGAGGDRGRRRGRCLQRVRRPVRPPCRSGCASACRAGRRWTPRSATTVPGSARPPTR